MSAVVVETPERKAALSALEEGLARETRLWCAAQGEEADPEAVISFAVAAAPGLLEMLGRRGFDLRRRTRWPAGRGQMSDDR